MSSFKQPGTTTRPEDLRAVMAAGLQCYQAGKFSDAERILRGALQSHPGSADIQHMLGLVQMAQGRFAEAITLLERAFVLQPQSPALLTNLGKAYFETGDVPKAIEQYRAAIKIDPRFVESHYNLGNAYYRLQQEDASIASYRQAIALRPALFAAHYNLGNVFLERRDWKAAEACYREATKLNPRHFKAHSNLGTAYFTQNKLEPAIACYRAALGLCPDDSDAYYSLANALAVQDTLDEAAAVCRKGLTFKPKDSKLLSLSMYITRRMCMWEGDAPIAAAFIASCREMDFDAATFPLLSLVDDPAVHLAGARHYTANKLAVAHPLPALPVLRGRSKIRIAYCSADFGQHVMSHLFAGMFELHDRDAFEVHGISFGADDGSAMRKRVFDALDHTLDIQHLGNRAAAEKIRALGFDIVIDMKGYTKNHRAELFAHRLAPVQVNYVGYPGTMGADFMDYILVDSFVVPAEEQINYAEKLVHLPGCYWINDIQIRVADQTPSRSECGLPDQAFVFLSFSNSYKITPGVFAVWMRLLHAKPDGVLWLLKDNRWVEQSLRAEAQKAGIDPARLIFAPRVPVPDHLARHRLADLALDTFPYNGHTTVSDALWVGLPVVTYAGRSFAARVAGSMIANVGLPELITYNLKDYEALAMRLASNSDELSAIKNRLIQNAPQASLFDARKTTRAIERAYRMMFDIVSAGEAPRFISIDATP